MSRQLSEHFHAREFACRCGCGLDEVDPTLVAGLEQLRIVVGHSPIVVLSGARCAAHNRKVGGSTHSQHLAGRAADILVRNTTVLELWHAAVQVDAFRLGGIGIYPHEEFVHVDTRNGAARWGRLRSLGGLKRYTTFEAALEVTAEFHRREVAERSSRG